MTKCVVICKGLQNITHKHQHQKNEVLMENISSAVKCVRVCVCVWGGGGGGGGGSPLFFVGSIYLVSAHVLGAWKLINEPLQLGTFRLATTIIP